MISFDQAYRTTLSSIKPLETETIPLDQLTGRVLAQDIFAQVNSPSTNVSIKDGFAVRSEDIENASPEQPVALHLIGRVAAGDDFDGTLHPMSTVRILSGAPIPRGAHAVLPEELVWAEDERILAQVASEPGRNILKKGTDIRRGDGLFQAGTVLMPTQVGLMAAAGLAEASVTRRPRVAIIATGDEVIAPGTPLKEGQLYASNLVTLSSWCRHYGMQVTTQVVRDSAAIIRNCVQQAIKEHDALVTSGGAWKGDRDLVVKVLEELGWEKAFHHVKMGPGKAIGFGLLERKPVFCLPGGPPSNHMGFLQVVIPGLHTMMGYAQPGLPILLAQLAEDMRGRIDWTQFVNVKLEERESGLVAIPLKMKSRLSEMATSNGIVRIPEGCEELVGGSMVPVQQVQASPNPSLL